MLKDQQNSLMQTPLPVTENGVCITLNDYSVQSEITDHMVKAADFLKGCFCRDACSPIPTQRFIEVVRQLL
jgi:hypothetical protein